MADFVFDTAVDTVVRQVLPDDTFGSDLTLNVSGTVGAQAQSLVQFDIFGTDAGQIASGATIQSATLTFDVTDASLDTIALHQMLTAWDETATWNSFTDGIDADGLEAMLAANGTIVSPALGSITIDVTQSVQAWSDGAENHGWAFFGGSDAFAVQSAEGTTAPVLNISTTPQPVSVSFQDGLNGYTGTNDTYLREDRGNADYSSRAKVYVEGMEASGGEMQALLSFDSIFGSAPGQIPLGSTITSATVSLDIGDSTGDPITVYDMLLSWDDAPTQSWNVFTDGIQTDGIEAASVATASLPTGISPLSAPIDVTSSLQAWSDGGENNGWLIRSDGDNLWRFASSESGNGPVLDVTYVAPDNPPPPPPPTETRTFQDGINGYSSTEDTYLREIRPTSDYSSRTNIYIEGSDPSGGQLQGLLSFDNIFGGLANQIPDGATITSATLEMSIGNGTNNPITFHEMLIDWTNYSDQSWSAFGDGIQADDIEASSAPVISLASGLATGTSTLDVTESLQAWADGTANYGWLIQSTGENSWRFASSESGEAPVLTVTYTFDGEPPDPTPIFNLGFIAVHDTLLYNADDPSGFGSGDPSGVAYVPGLDLLYMVDSEHNESPYFSPINLFVANLDGSYVTAYSLSAFSEEPTGIGYNSANGLLYISDDDEQAIFVVDPSDPSVLIDTIDLSGLGINDAEEPVFDPTTGNMFVVDGAGLALYELASDGTLVSTSQFTPEVVEVEGFAYDAENDVFFAAGGGSTRGTIFQLDRDLNVLASSDLLNDYRNPVTGGKPKIKGLEYAPSSDPNDGDKKSLYVANYGNDQIPDGQLFEVDPYDEFVFV